MKKLFTLIAFVLLAGNAFGQSRWTTIFDQDMENGFSDPNMEFFECDEKHGLQRGPVRVVEDPTNPSNHCIKVIIRSDAEAEADGNRETEGWGDNVHLISWDTQFFIYFKEPIPENKEIRFRANVKGEKDGSFQFQSHEYPQNYIYYSLFPNAADGNNVLSYTTEWTDQPYKKQDVVSHDASPSGNFQCIALNMTCAPYDGNVVYLDDIKVEIRDKKEDQDLSSSFINFLKHGTQTAEVFEMNNRTYTTFTARDYVTGEDFQAEIVNDPLDGKPALKVSAPDVTEVPDLDAEGNEQYDEEGNLKTKLVYLRTLKDQEGNDSIVQVASDDWLCQFFVTVRHKFVKNEKFRIKYSARADKPASFDTQAHTYPGGYQHWACIGSQDLTSDWQDFIIGYDEDATIPADAGGKGCQTVAFNLFKLKESNTYYFRFDEFAFSAANVSDEDRTLGSADLSLAVNTDDNEKAVTVDMADMLAAFEVQDFSFLNSEGNGIKLYSMIPPEDEGDDPVYTFSSLLPWTDGGFINGQGYFMDDENGINIRLDEESIDGSKINVMVWNNPDSGISFDNGETLNTKLAISQSGWYYIYNITLSKDGVNGIKDIVAEKKNGVIYDLMGRKVSNPTKGIYIMDGKKYIMK